MLDRTADAPAHRALDQAAALVDQGRPLEAIEALTAANRSHRSPDLERALVDLRHRSFEAVPRIPVADLPPPVSAEPAAGPLPELTPDQLDPTSLRDGLARHGCVLVRGLIPPEQAQRLADGIDAALAAFDDFDADAGSDGGSDSRSHDGADDGGWYSPFVPQPGAYRVGGRRQWVRASGAVWTADSPRMLFELVELVDRTGIGELVTAYLGERPALSANKCTLRRVPLTAQAGWHQDGAFLGQHVRTLNLWLALGRCGTDAPGLDLVPRRFDHVVETGSEGAVFDWSVSPEVVAREAGATEVLRPEFLPGDALLFDHLLLHSTAVTDQMTRERHAMETWFFSPSAYPGGQIPLVY